MPSSYLLTQWYAAPKYLLYVYYFKTEVAIQEFLILIKAQFSLIKWIIQIAQEIQNEKYLKKYHFKRESNEGRGKSNKDMKNMVKNVYNWK